MELDGVIKLGDLNVSK